MNNEFVLEPRPAAIRSESCQLLDDLDNCAHDPDRLYIELGHGLGIDVGRKLDFDDDGRPRDLASRFEATKSLEELTRITCHYGVAVPRAIGEWLELPNRCLDGQKPLDVLFENFSDQGFQAANLRRVVEAGSGFFGLAGGGDVALFERFGVDFVS